MRTSTRRTLLVGAAAGLSLTLVAPAVSANASELHRSSSAHRSSAHHESRGRHLGQSQAMTALRQALRAANAQYRQSVRAARAAFQADPSVTGAKATFGPVIESSIVGPDIANAWDGYAMATAKAAGVRDGKIADASTAWVTATETAYAAFDALTAPTEVKARALYRSTVRGALTTLDAAVTGASKTFADSTKQARAARKAAINAAKTAFESGAKDQKAIDALHLAIQTAEAMFRADGTVTTAAGIRDTAVHGARDAYRATVTTATTLFASSTGHAPLRGLALLPNQHH